MDQQFFFMGSLLFTVELEALLLQEIGELSSRLYDSNSLFRFGVILTVVGFSFKISLVPFHSWVPDVYQGSATPVTSIMATAVKSGFFYCFS